MAQRLRSIGIVLAVVGVLFAVVGVYGFTQIRAGQDALQAFSQAQDIRLNYNDEGQLVDRGETEGAEAIMTLLTEDWEYPVKASELDPNDPLVNTASEYMYQMAVIAYHVMHGTQTITLAEDVEYEGEMYRAGEHAFDVDGRYWTDFDRQHPLEGKAREQAWTGTAHALIAELGVGAVTASTLTLGLLVSAMFVGVGVAFTGLGGGLVWATGANKDA